MAQQLAARLGPSREVKHRLRRTLRSLRHGPGVRCLHATKRRLTRARGMCRTGYCARGRWRGLAGLRADAPSHTSAHQAPLVRRAPEGPEGTGGLRDRHFRAFNASEHTKTDIRIGCRSVVELGGFEPPTFSLRTRRATNCAIAPRTRTA